MPCERCQRKSEWGTGLSYLELVRRGSSHAKWNRLTHGNRFHFLVAHKCNCRPRELWT